MNNQAPILKLKDMHNNIPECNVSNPHNCKEYYNPKICAFSRKDRICMKKKKTRHKPEEKTENQNIPPEPESQE